MLMTDELDRPVLEQEKDRVPLAPLGVRNAPMLFDWNRARRAFAEKDFNLRTYVKYALEIEYGPEASFIAVNPGEFAELLSGEVTTSWGETKLLSVSEADVLKAIAELAKKDQLETSVQLQLTLHF